MPARVEHTSDAPLACVQTGFDAFQESLQNASGSEHRRLHAFLAEEDITFAARWGLK
jgi:catabolite regulation protein CreA